MCVYLQDEYISLCAQSHNVVIYSVYKDVYSKNVKNFYSIVSSPSAIELIQFKLAVLNLIKVPGH